MENFSNLPEIIESKSLLTDYKDYKNTDTAISSSEPNILRDILQYVDTIQTGTDKSSKYKEMLKELLIKKIKKSIIYNILLKAIKLMKETIENYITAKEINPDKLFDIETNIAHVIGETIKTENMYKISDVEIGEIKALFKNMINNMINNSSNYDKESISVNINNIIGNKHKTIKDEYNSLFPSLADSKKRTLKKKNKNHETI